MYGCCQKLRSVIHRLLDPASEPLRPPSVAPAHEPEENKLGPGSKPALLRMAIDARREEYEELSELWRHIDTKAQGAIALSGILLTAFVAFITKRPAVFYVADRVLSVIAVVFFSASIAALAISLMVRDSTAPPHFGGLQKRIEDLLLLEDQERIARMEDLARAELSLWQTCNANVRSAIDRKTQWLWIGQILISTSILWLAVVAIMQIVE